MTPSTAPFRLAMVQLVCPSYKLLMFQAIARLPGVELTLFAGDRPPPGEAPGVRPAGVRSVAVRNRVASILGFTVVWQNLTDVLDPSKFDLVILPEGVLYLSNYRTMWRCRRAGTPFGLYTHGYNHKRKRNRVARIVERFRALVHRRCDVLIAYSADGVRHLHERNRVPRERLFLARNTLDVEAIQDRVAGLSREEIRAIRRDAGAGDDDVLLVFAGRIVPIKHPDWVVRAVTRLRAKGHPVRALFVGDGDGLPALRELVASLPHDARDAIRFSGRVPVSEVERYLRAGDITVMPGLTGLAIVHSFAVGRPYVTIDAPFHSPEIEHLRDGVTGRLAPFSFEGFCDAVEDLVADRAGREAMGRAAHEYAARELGSAKQLEGFANAVAWIRDRPAAGASPSAPGRSRSTPRDPPGHRR